MSTKYETLDGLILNKIGGHPVRFAKIYVGDVAEECDRLAVLDGSRVCDRRLQALRKAGKIVSTGKGWVCGEAQS